MTWWRGLLAALVVGGLLFLGSAGCGSGGAGGREKQGTQDTAQPVGKVLDETDEEGRHYREIGGKHAPEVGIQVQPGPGGAWEIRLTLRRFRLSPAGARPEAVAGRGTARLSVDGRRVTDLRTPACRLPARLMPHGLHHVRVRLYADDGTVWAVDGKPVQSTAAVTVSGEGAPAGAGGGGAASGALSGAGAPMRTGGRGSPDPGGKAS
jgi:hypothetical protein